MLNSLKSFKYTRWRSYEASVSAGPGCWLWDYLRRSGASGFLLPLSGGADSASVAAIVGSMCQLVVQAIQVSLWSLCHVWTLDPPIFALPLIVHGLIDTLLKHRWARLSCSGLLR